MSAMLNSASSNQLEAERFRLLVNTVATVSLNDHCSISR